MNEKPQLFAKVQNTDKAVGILYIERERLVRTCLKLSKTYQSPTVTVDCAEDDKLQARLKVTQNLGLSNTDSLTDSLTDKAEKFPGLNV